MEKMRKNSNPYKVYWKFLGVGTFYTSDAVKYLSTSTWDTYNKRAIEATIKALKKLQELGLVTLVSTGTRGGLHSALWQIVEDKD